MVQFSNVMFFVFHAKYSPLMNELRTVTFSQFQKASFEIRRA